MWLGNNITPLREEEWDEDEDDESEMPPPSSPPSSPINSRFLNFFCFLCYLNNFQLELILRFYFTCLHQPMDTFNSFGNFLAIVPY